MLVEGLCWLRPSVRWIGARLAEDPERAWDEEVLLRGGGPRDYAEAVVSKR